MAKTKIKVKKSKTWKPFTGKVTKPTWKPTKTKSKGKSTATKKVVKKVSEKVSKASVQAKKAVKTIKKNVENVTPPSVIPKGKKALMAKKMEHMREIANLNKALGISKKKK